MFRSYIKFQLKSHLKYKLYKYQIRDLYFLLESISIVQMEEEKPVHRPQ